VSRIEQENAQEREEDILGDPWAVSDGGEKSKRARKKLG